MARVGVLPSKAGFVTMMSKIYGLLLFSLVFWTRLSEAASPFAGFYVGQIYTSISGNVSLPDRPIGGVALTINSDGIINSTGDLSGSVTDSGAITWNANSTGFATGKIENGVVTASTSIDNNGTISTFRIEAKNSGPGIGEGNALAGRLSQKNPVKALRDMNRIRFLGDKFVAVGRSGAFATSFDGVNWTRIGVPTVLDLYDVAYGNGHYVVVGDSSARFWSTNGVDWVANPAAAGPVAAVAFGNGKFVSMHFNGVVSTSSDGVAWAGGTGFSGSGYAGLDFVNGEFVAWNGSSIGFSADGSNWSTKGGETGVGNITVSLAIHSKIAFGNGVYVVAGQQGLAVSSNGTTWTKATNAPGVFFGNSASVTFGNGIFVVCDTADRLWISSDAAQWKQVDEIELHSLAYGNDTFVGVGDELWISADGSLWIFPQGDVLQPDYHESGYIDPYSESPIVGTFLEGSTGTYSFGHDGYITWYKYQGVGGSGTAPKLTTETLRFAMNLNYFEAPVIVGNHGAMVLAEDRSTVTFQLVPPVTSADLVHGAKGNSTLVFVGTQGAIIWSTNFARTNWSVANSGTSANLKHVAWYDNFVTGLPTQFIAVGDGGTLLTSGNGRSWTPRDSKTKMDLVGSAYSNERKQFLVAAADGTLLQSADGVTWTVTTPLPAPRTLRYFRNTDTSLKFFTIEGGGDDGLIMTETPGNVGRFTMGSPRAYYFNRLTSAALGNGRFLALGEKIGAISMDAQNWTARSNSLSALGVAFGEGKFVAIGSGRVFGVSGDGLKWQLRTNLLARDFRAITFGGGKFVAVGNNGAIGVSDDGVTWTDKSIASSVSYNDITWNNGTFMAGGTSGSVLISTNGGQAWIEKPTFITEIKGIAFGNSKWVAVALNGSSAASADGSQWETKKYPFISPVESSPNFSEIAFADGSFYATSSRGEIFISTDGLNWKRNFTGLGADLRGAVVGNGGILFVNDNEIHLLNVPDSGSPVISQGPVSTTVNEDGTLTLTATALGGGLEFSWLKDGAPIASGARISGADSTKLVVSPFLMEDAGRYEFAVANKFGSRSSGPAIVSVNPKALIATQPKSTVEAIGNKVTLSVEATGQNLGYQWFKNGAAIPGATSAKFEIAAFSAGDAADYYVEITNAVGVRQSEHAALSAVSIAAGYGVDPNYPFPGAISPQAISAMAFQPDGKVILAGSIGVPGGFKTVVRLNADGTLDSSFSADNANNQIRALHVLADGRILIGGFFTQVGTAQKVNIARLNADGKTDGAYLSPVTANSGVYVFKERSDGKILVGGNFGQFGGTTAVRYLGLLNADGTAATFSPPRFAEYILAIYENADGSLLLGGGSVSSRGLLTKLLPNNTIDVTFPAGGNGPTSFGTGSTPNLQAILPAPNGQFYVGGYFNYYNNQPRVDVVRIQPNGELDTTFVSGIGADSFGSVRTMALLGDNLLIGGDLYSYAGSTNYQHLILLDSSGAVVPTPKLPKFGGPVLEAKVLKDDSIIVRGDFQTVDGKANKCLVHLIAGGGSDLSLAIVRQPQSAKLKQGYPATLAVAATGRGTLTFQWRKDGLDLPGETKPTLSIAAASSENAGKYSVEVKDSSGTVTSQDAVLSFNQEPASGGFADWAVTYALPTGKNGLVDDADGDGFSNAAEFAFGTNPAQSGSKPQLDQKSVSVNGQSFPAVQYIRNKNASGVAIQIRASNSVTFDSDAPVVEVTPAEDLGNGLERVTVRSANAAPHTFFFEVKTAAN